MFNLIANMVKNLIGISSPVSLVESVVSSDSVTISWVKSKNSTISSQLIERSLSSDFNTLNTSFSVGRDVEIYVDNTIESATTYYYRIKAISNSTNSDYTNTITVETLAIITLQTTYDSSISNFNPLIEGSVNSDQIGVTWIFESGQKITANNPDANLAACGLDGTLQTVLVEFNQDLAARFLLDKTRFGGVTSAYNITTADLSLATAMEFLQAGYNQLTTISLPKNTVQPINHIDLSQYQGTSLDLLDVNFGGYLQIDGGVPNLTALTFHPNTNAFNDIYLNDIILLTEIDFSNIIINGSLRIRRDGATGSISTITFADATTLNIFDITNQPVSTLDFTKISIITGNFIIQNTEIAIAPPLGTTILSSNIDISGCLLPTSQVNQAIDLINDNKANFANNTVAKICNIGGATMGVPDTAHINIMQNLANDENWTFTYWNGVENVVFMGGDVPVLTTTAASSTSLQLDWLYGAPMTFIVEYSLDQINWIQVVLGDVNTYTITGLTVNTQYYTRVKTNTNVYSNEENTPTPNPFIFTVDTTQAGTSDSNSFTLPLTDFGVYNLFVKTEDGVENITAFNQAEITHTFATGGTKTYEIWGDYSGFQFNNLGDKSKIKNVTRWGDLDITLNSVFYGCNNLTSSATDAPIISSTDLSEMFRSASLFNGDISSWDVSNVTDMSSMFQTATAFNGDISSWDVSSVTNMFNMFNGASAFNQNIGNWNVSNVTIMGGMFNGASVFNQNLNTWNVSNVIEMSQMFKGASAFNQSVSWSTPNLLNASQMFSSASSFNSTLNLDLGNVTNFTDFLSSCALFNQPLNHLDFSAGTSFVQFLRGCSSFNQDMNITLTSTVGVNFFRFMQSATSFQSSLAIVNTSSITDLGEAFYNAGALFNNSDLVNWDVSNVTDMNQMFFGTAFNQPIGSWNVSKVTNMSGMFRQSQFNQPIANWNVSKVRFFNTIFFQTNFNQVINNWIINSTETVNMELMFNTVYSQDVSNWNFSKVINMNGFMGGSGTWVNSFYESLLIKLASQELEPQVILTLSSKYTAGSAAEDAKTFLTNPLGTPGVGIYTGRFSPGWSITDGGII